MTFDFQPPASAAVVDWALAYAAAAMAVFPCRADKKPLTEHGVKDATTDPDQIRAWWKQWPHAEIGWAVPETLVVVDLDRKAGADGLKDFFEHEGIEADKVETAIAVTPSGGRHLVFRRQGRDVQERRPGKRLADRSPHQWRLCRAAARGQWPGMAQAAVDATCAGACLVASEAFRAPPRRGEAFHG
jgi:hypothetical protein